MKSKIFKYFALPVVMVTLLTTSCEKWIDPELNIDPDSPQDVYSALILSSAELNLAYMYQGMDYSGTTGYWLQYFEGLDRQAYGTYRYTYSSDDCNNLYGSLYAGVMMDCKKIIDKTSAVGFESPHIRGMAKVLQAIALGTAVGVWGDLPFSEAFQGDAKLQPKFDTEESLYTAVQDLLTGAIEDLSSDVVDFEEKYIKVAGQDLIYGGDAALWIEAANSLKARYELRLSRKEGKFDADNVLSLLANGFTGNADDFQFPFPDAAYNEDNPLSQFSYERYGYAWTDPNFISKLDAVADPRSASYVASDDNLGDNFIGGYALGYWNSPALFMSYTEAKFIESECHWINGDADLAAASYNEAVAASLDKWGVTDDAWLAINAVEDGTTITLAKIMNAKYIAMFGQGEAWADYRRHQLAFPALTPPANNVTSNVQPQCYPYPTDEKIANGANVPTRAGLTVKLWAFE